MAFSETSKPVAVIDTNVWISGLVIGGNPAKVIGMFIEGDIVVVTSEELLSELRRKIHQRFPLFAPQLPRLEASIREKAILVHLGARRITVSRDPNDNMVIETALTGNAHYIISGDKDLLVLDSYEGVMILNPEEFLITDSSF
jgi:putative PIN family toxin of toxin-antitoxin system